MRENDVDEDDDKGERPPQGDGAMCRISSQSSPGFGQASAWVQLGVSASERLALCLTNPEVQRCRRVSQSWRAAWGRSQTSRELWDRDLGADARQLAWRGLLLDGLGARSLDMSSSYESLSATPSSHDAAIQRDLARTLPQEALFRDRSGKGQSALFRLLRALAVHLWDVGYVQSLNFIVATLVCVFPEDEALAFHCAQALLFRYSLIDFYRPRFPKLGVTVWQFDRLVEGFLPKVRVTLHRVGVSSEYFAVPWFLTLFASDLSQPVVRRIWDRFLIAGWRVIAQVGLALLYEVQDSLAALDACEALTFLKRFTRTRRYEAEALLLSAAKFPVSHRMLSELEAAFEASGGKLASQGIAPCADGQTLEEEVEEAMPAAQLLVAKDLASGQVSWEVHRPPSASPRPLDERDSCAPSSAGGPRAASAAAGGSQATTGSAKGGNTVLPFLFHNLDTGETTVLEKEWDEYNRELEAGEAPRDSAPEPASARGSGFLSGGAFWLAGRQKQASQKLRG